MTTTHDPVLAGFRGEVLTPRSPGYDDARRVWNHAVDRYPALVLRCTSTEDVRVGLAHARAERLPVAVRSGGHSMAGLSVCDDGTVLDLSPMKRISIDPGRRTATVQPGVIWRELDAATQEYGLAVPGGEVSDTGVAGLTLGGGIGWLGRKYGLACDNLRSVTLVTAAGDVVRASANEHPDLFWAVRGAGANFGVVVELELDLHPVGPTVYGGELVHPGSRTVEALRLLVDQAATAPDEVRLMAAMVTAPDAPFVPEAARGEKVCVLAGAHCGDVAEAERALAPLRALGPPAVDTMRKLSYVELQQTVDKTLPPERRTYVKSDFLGALDDRALEIIAEHHRRASSPMCQVLLHQLGGAIARVPAGQTAYPNRDAEWMLTVVGIWLDPAEDPAPHVAWARGLWQAMRPWSTGTYVNHLGDEGADRVREAYGELYPRLLALKQTWDPDNVFRLNQNIAPPARMG